MLAVLLLFLGPPIQETQRPDQFETLEHVKLTVQTELTKAANYTCVQTIERTYYRQKHACQADVKASKPKEFMRDRLRLDVAVSDKREIFSWHGENKFSSGGITEVVPKGPRTSGQFVGFLRNIFLSSGVQFKFTGMSQVRGKPVYTFNYGVQFLTSDYYLQGRGKASRIAFHGSFSADAETFELVSLTIVGDEVPLSSGICSVETDVEYQTVNISGQLSVVPASFALRMTDDQDVFTVNRSEYTQCRAFRGESTLLFTVTSASPKDPKKHVVDRKIPAGLTLKGMIQTPIDDRSSYIGDPVLATLAEPLSIPGEDTVIPKGAVLHGVISQLEQHSEGLEYWLFAVTFERLLTGDDSYLLSARPLPTTDKRVSTSFGSDRALSQEIAEAAKQGLWFMDGLHFRLPQHFTGMWQTQELSRQEGAEPGDGTR